MSWVIPTVLTYGAAGYLTLLWYSDYLKKQEAAGVKKITKLTSTYVDASDIHGTPRQRVDIYLEKCENLLRRIARENRAPEKIVEQERNFLTKTALATTRPVNRTVLKRNNYLIEVSDTSDYENVLRMKFNRHRTTTTRYLTAFEYSHNYLNGMVRIRKPIRLQEACYKLVWLNMAYLLHYCLDRTAALEDAIQLEMHKIHTE